MLSTLFLFCPFCAWTSRVSFGKTSGYALRSSAEPAAKTAPTTRFIPLDLHVAPERYLTSRDSCNAEWLVSVLCVDSGGWRSPSLSSASLSSQSPSMTSSIYPSHTFQYFHLFGYATLQLNAQPTTCQKSFAHRRTLPWFATTPSIRSSSPDSLLPSSPPPLLPRRLPRVLGGVIENASPRFAFSGPSVARRLRRNVMARHASSARSPRGACVVFRGCTSSVLTISTWRGTGAKAGVSRCRGCEAPEVTRSVRRVRALISAGWLAG
jgi:hypothetical protein